MAVEAVERIRNEDMCWMEMNLICSDGKVKYPIENIGIIKAHGQSALESELVDGLVLQETVPPNRCLSVSRMQR